jgi:transposase InsO family protein
MLERELIHEPYQARKIIEDSRNDYNQTRLHSSLGDMTPAEFKLRELSKIGQNL